MLCTTLLRTKLNLIKGTRTRQLLEEIKNFSAKTMSSENINNNEHQKDEYKDKLKQQAEKNTARAEEEENKLPPEEYRLENDNFDGYSDDDSGDENCPYKTYEQKLKRLKELEKKTCLRNLEEVYPEVQMKSMDKLEEELKDYKKSIK